MADRNVSQEAILAEETNFYIRRNGQTDYAIFDDIIDDTVSFKPIGGETKEYTAISGVGFEVPTKVKFVEAQFPTWLTTNELEMLRGVFGEPTTTSAAGVYTHTFAIGTLSQQMDFKVIGPKFGGTSEQVVITGSVASIKFDSLDIEKDGLFKFMTTIKASTANVTVAIKSTTDLS